MKKGEKISNKKKDLKFFTFSESFKFLKFFSGFTAQLEDEKKAAEKARNDAKEKIGNLMNELEEARSQIDETNAVLDKTVKEMYESQENYVTLIEDTLDEISELHNFKQELIFKI